MHAKRPLFRVDFNLSSHDLQIEIPLIRIRGIARVTLCSHEDPGGDIGALFPVLSSLQGCFHGASKQGQTQPDGGNALFAAWPPFLVTLPWMSAPARQRHLIPARRIRSNPRRLTFRPSRESSIQHPFTDLSGLPDVIRCRRSGS